MPKSPNQKLKLLYIRDYLMKYTDEEHHVSSKDITAFLNQHDIEVERKTIYSDIESLKSYGVDINNDGKGYYIGERDFEPSEIKLLVDIVQSSKFITERKTNTLIRKLEELTNKYEADSLQRRVYVHNRIKSMNESVYINVDAISNAINEDKKIQFKYFFTKVDKKPEYKNEGCLYEISPYALIWDDENYYMLGFDSNKDIMKHYRVDRMKYIRVTDIIRDGKEEFEKTDLSTYNTKVFSMFGGKPEKVTMRFTTDLVDAVIDRFGKDVMIIDEFDGHFLITVDVVVSNPFFGWVFGFKNKCEIVEPESVRNQLVDMAQSLVENYSEK